MRVGGVILCGGKSSRMGTPKEWLPIAGVPMLCRIAETLGEVVHPIVVVSARGQALPSLPAGILHAHDERPDRGPMEGLAAGLSAMSPHADAAFVASCDLPLLSAEFVRRMIALAEGFELCIPDVADGAHPLASVYNVSVLPEIHKLLARDQLRMLDLPARVLTRRVGDAELRDIDPELASLRNVNSPEEYASIQGSAGQI